MSGFTGNPAGDICFFLTKQTAGGDNMNVVLGRRATVTAATVQANLPSGFDSHLNSR